MAVHPLRPATRRRLGRPLPHQQADRPRAHPTPKKSFQQSHQRPFISGIRPSFPSLSRSAGQITHVLLTRSPLEYPQQARGLSVRLACVKHAASVRPEPGSNSPQKGREKPKPNKKTNQQPPNNHHQSSRKKGSQLAI